MTPAIHLMDSRYHITKYSIEREYKLKVIKVIKLMKADILSNEVSSEEEPVYTEEQTGTMAALALWQF